MELYRTMQLPSMQWGALQQTLIAADVINILGVLRIPNQALSLMPVCTCVYVFCTLTECTTHHSATHQYLTGLPA